MASVQVLRSSPSYTVLGEPAPKVGDVRTGPAEGCQARPWGLGGTSAPAPSKTGFPCAGSLSIPILETSLHRGGRGRPRGRDRGTGSGEGGEKEQGAGPQERARPAHVSGCRTQWPCPPDLESSLCRKPSLAFPRTGVTLGEALNSPAQFLEFTPVLSERRNSAEPSGGEGLELRPCLCQVPPAHGPEAWAR